MIYPAGTSLPILFALLPRTKAHPPSPSFLLERHRPPKSSAPFLPFSFRLARESFRESRAFWFTTVRNVERRRKGGNEKKGVERVEESELLSSRLFPVTFDGRLVTRLNLRRIEYIALTIPTYTDYRDDDGGSGLLARGGEEEVKRELTFNARCAPTASFDREISSLHIMIQSPTTRERSREKSVAARYCDIRSDVSRRDGERDGNASAAESATKIDFISPHNKPRSRGFDCRCDRGVVSLCAPTRQAVPLNPTGITCAGHNMSGSIKIRTVQIKLSLRTMSDREYLPGCELPFTRLLSRPRCDSRMRRTHIRIIEGSNKINETAAREFIILANICVSRYAIASVDCRCSLFTTNARWNLAGYFHFSYNGIIIMAERIRQIEKRVQYDCDSAYLSTFS